MIKSIVLPIFSFANNSNTATTLFKSSLNCSILFMHTFYLVYNQIRGFKTRHANSTGVGGLGNVTTNKNRTTKVSSQITNDFDGYRLSVSNNEKYSQYSNQSPLTSFVNRVNNLDSFFFF